MSQGKHRHVRNPICEFKCSFILSGVIWIIQFVQLVQMKDLWNFAASYLLVIQRPQIVSLSCSMALDWTTGYWFRILLGVQRLIIECEMLLSADADLSMWLMYVLC